MAHSQRQSLLAWALVLVASWLWTAWPTTAHAQAEVQDQCFFPGRDVTVAAGQTIDCRSLRVIGGNVVMETGATLLGNLEVGGGNAAVAGRVAQDVFVFGDLDLGTGGAIDGDVFVAGDLVLPAGAKIGGDVTVLGSAEVGGAVLGDLTAAGQVELRSTAAVNRVSAGGAVQRAPGAEVRDADRSGQGGGGPVTVGLLVLFTLLSALFAALLAALAATAVDRVQGAAAHSPLLSLVVGLVAWGGALLLALVLVPTLVGPLLVFLAVAGGILLGWVAFGQWLGQRLWRGGGRAGVAALGGALLALVVMLLIGGGSLVSGLSGASGVVVCLGLVLLLVLWTWGLGASLLTLFGLRWWPARLAPAGTMPPPVPLPRDGTEGDDRPGSATETADGAAAALPGLAELEAPEMEPMPEPAGDEAPEMEPMPEPAGDEAPPVKVATATAAGAMVDDGEQEAAATAPVQRVEPVGAPTNDDEIGPLQDRQSSTADEGPTVAGTARDDVQAAVAEEVPADGGSLAETPGAGPAEARAAAAASDVRDVPGVSPIYGMLLAQAGIGTVGELARADPAQVTAAITVPGVVAVDEATVTTWIEAARQMAEGG